MVEVDIVLPRKNFDVVCKEKFVQPITGIYGSSGSGKTSLLHSIAGLAKPSKGKITIGNTVVFDSEAKINLPVEKRRIGYVFQEGRLFPHMTVEKNLRYGMKKKHPSKVTFEEVAELLNLRHILKSKPSQISGGERQRTALGRALLSSPNLLLLDEPFSAVDTNLRNQILPFILKIQRTVNIPMLVVSHDIPDILKLTNTLLLINKGNCIGHGEYHDLLKDENCIEILGNGSLLNAVNLTVKETIKGSKITILECKDKSKEVRIKCEKTLYKYKNGQDVKIFVNADDIALSTEKLSNITIQNQLSGIVKHIIPRGSSLLCIVDVGFKLVVEITANSQQRMEIKEGKQVWCLFKSVAIDIAV